MEVCGMGDGGRRRRRRAAGRVALCRAWPWGGDRPVCRRTGERIEAYERRLVPDGDGGFKSVLRDVSGRHLQLQKHFVTHLQAARDRGFLLSMPPYLDEERMSADQVEMRLEALGAPRRLTDKEGKEVSESAMEWRQRARTAELAARVVAAAVG